ncbi:Transcriptional activator of maltose regulon, MalT [Candidatus Syntrophocurvum alkaliphilum]|uniref:Transcriptional activator of maltose regulon, MalT n=1 Tax=Candidatus Syntrophocurvum alkaliphilum TaxID=2293317 RepID=A0A6I6DC95_9FIRM|nr:LuxR C-terminal-related transcriptional regulator [Candidatus Syntrophocurvum alkaliphilum]QGT98780.1 Transcriptional activator of maltose regulon, MalT [Candidatus Syntrophocurvum alkaliphilum]
MSNNILKIKISMPPLSPTLISRPRITKQLDNHLIIAQGFSRPLTLISAPAGYGKTTLVQEWLCNRAEQVAWYSIDENDDNLERFWLHLISALQAVNSDLGKGIIEMLRSSSTLVDSLDIEGLLNPLLNDLFDITSPIYLVLDDYHEITDVKIQKSLIYFIENLPPTLHVVITTRSDPPMPLPQWRAKKRLVEIRQKELMLTKNESDILLEKLVMHQLSNEELNTLYYKIDGWVTGLQLVALSLSSQQSSSEFIENFAGSQRHALFFLIEEVFVKQPQDVQEFLLQTSILNRFCSSLCDAVTSKTNSLDIIKKLEKDNLFIIALDNNGQWYRYHPLFGEVLFNQLRKKEPEKVAELHERAGQWFLENEAAGEAIRYLFKGKSPHKAMEIFDQLISKLSQTENWIQSISWIEELSVESIQDYPRLLLYKAFIFLVKEGLDEARACIELVETKSYEDPIQQEYFLGIVAVVKAYYFSYSNNIPAALENAEKALQLLSESDTYWRLGATIFLGDSKQFSGNPKNAYPYYKKAYEDGQSFNNSYVTLSNGVKVIVNLWTQGNLKESEQLTEKLLRLAKDSGLSKIPKVAYAWTLYGELLREKGQLNDAKDYIDWAISLAEAEKITFGWSYMHLCKFYYSNKEYQKALEVIDHIEIINQEVNLPVFITSTAFTWKSRILIDMDKIDKAKENIYDNNILQSTVNYGGQECGHLVLSRILIKEKNYDNANEILNQIKEHASFGNRKGLLLETILLKACLEELLKKTIKAESYLENALQIGIECGYFQTFIDEGALLIPVLDRVVDKIDNDYELLIYAQKILNHLKRENQSNTNSNDSDNIKSKHKNLLIEELSSRELEVLNLLNSGLSNQDISNKLHLSLGTVKWHTSNIYGKLGVKNRTQAVARARELNLISSE